MVAFLPTVERFNLQEILKVIRSPKTEIDTAYIPTFMRLLLFKSIVV